MDVAADGDLNVAGVVAFGGGDDFRLLHGLGLERFQLLLQLREPGLVRVIGWRRFFRFRNRFWGRWAVLWQKLDGIGNDVVLSALRGNHHRIPIPREKIVGAQRDELAVDRRALCLIDIFCNLAICMADEHWHFAGAICAVCV